MNVGHEKAVASMAVALVNLQHGSRWNEYLSAVLKSTSTCGDSLLMVKRQFIITPVSRSDSPNIESKRVEVLWRSKSVKDCRCYDATELIDLETIILKLFLGKESERINTIRLSSVILLRALPPVGKVKIIWPRVWSRIIYTTSRSLGYFLLAIVNWVSSTFMSQDHSSKCCNEFLKQGQKRFLPSFSNMARMQKKNNTEKNP